jgi:hypothetical protein
MEFSLGVSAALAAIKWKLIAIMDAGSTKQGAGATQNYGKTAIKDSLIAIKESLIVRRISGEIVVFG